MSAPTGKVMKYNIAIAAVVIVLLVTVLVAVATALTEMSDGASARSDVNITMAPSTPSALSTPARSSRTESSGNSSSVDSTLRYPGDTQLFERGVNIMVPWTGEISQDILVLSAQDICETLDRTGDPVAARNLAIEFGFEGQDTAPFIEQSVTFFCPQFNSIVPNMTNP